MKNPEECSTIEDVRAEIDRLDRELVTLIGERGRYVKVAARFKKDEAAVKAPDRRAAMLRARRAWADEQALDPDMIEKLFDDLVSHFIAQELSHWKTSR